MKILATPSHPAPARPADTAPAAHSGRVPATSKSAPPCTSPSTQVALSATSTRLLDLQEADQAVDMARVDALRAAIAAGELKIDPERIADSLIASARELLK